MPLVCLVKVTVHDSGLCCSVCVTSPECQVTSCLQRCVCVCARAHGYTRVLNITHVFAGVRQWKKPGQARGGVFILYLLLF